MKKIITGTSERICTNKNEFYLCALQLLIMKKTILLLLTLLLTKVSFTQTCTCSEQFSWLKETIEKNDAGFQYVIDQKGEAAYKNHNELYFEKVKTITNKNECSETLSGWLQFFRKGHLWIGLNPEQNQTENRQQDKEKIKQQFKNWEKYPYQEKEFNTYLSKLKEPGLEGIWTTPPYVIGIRKVKNEYLGFIMEADGIYWSKSQIKFKIKETKGKLSATYFMQDHSAKEMKNISLLGNNYLQMDWVTLKRVKPAFAADANLERHFKFLNTYSPLFEKLNEKTCILRIPSFEGSAKKEIDSVITANLPVITTTENLIIDLRNNGGGSDRSFEKILPLIYTNPIRTVGVEFLSTPLNNKRMEDFLTDPDFPEEAKTWAREGLEKLNKHPGEFVMLDSVSVSIDTFSKVLPYPKKVGIIINEGNGSTTEQFLLAAKQSQKVKLFGTTTFGVLDISNMHFINSPCNTYKLGYSLTRSKRIPEFTIDNKGIQPDFYIDHTIPNYEWIDFVNKILSNP